MSQPCLALSCLLSSQWLATRTLLPCPTSSNRPQLVDSARQEAAQLAAQRASLEAWQRRLEGRQAELEELEAAAADTLQDARDAAAAALADRDQVGSW